MRVACAVGRRIDSGDGGSRSFSRRRDSGEHARRADLSSLTSASQEWWRTAARFQRAWSCPRSIRRPRFFGSSIQSTCRRVRDADPQLPGVRYGREDQPRVVSPPRLQARQNPLALSGRIHIGPGLDYLERAFDHAKYGEISAEPWLDITIPSILDPDLVPGRAHVMSVYAHCAPESLRDADWQGAADLLLQRVLGVLERFAPGLGRLVVAAQTITPSMLQRDYGSRRPHLPRRTGARSALHYAPTPWIRAVRVAYSRSASHAAGNASGWILTGASGDSRLRPCRAVDVYTAWNRGLTPPRDS